MKQEIIYLSPAITVLKFGAYLSRVSTRLTRCSAHGLSFFHGSEEPLQQDEEPSEKEEDGAEVAESEEKEDGPKKFPSDGPNKELIEMIERDMLTKTPNVHWWVTCSLLT